MIETSGGTKQRLVAVVGPTAVGKTDLVLRIAGELHAEIVNVDSMQVYRWMDIGTAKPSLRERQAIRHHLLDIADPDEEYNVCRYLDDAERACAEIYSRNKLPLLTGGTGLYLKGFQEGVFSLSEDQAAARNMEETLREKLENELAEKGRAHLFAKLEKCDSATAARVHPNDTYRLLRALLIFEQTGVPWSVHLDRQKRATVAAGNFVPRREILKIGLVLDRDQLYERINRRTAKMFDAGLLEEVQSLLDRGYGADLKPMQSIGYRHAVKLLSGEWGREEAIRMMARDTRRYAKRQFTWFKKDREIKWFDPGRSDGVMDLVKEYLQG
ncbi:MAG: tRNA (adenosine(37)-N6)-dimethylallyltransferase MiaA [Desulfurivibrionaceae bacterium]|nr:tRNA (adenosine(37)-N6)-dimethylallyltransferase MiaA [Desulfurivibrionaceae bacterium]